MVAITKTFLVRILLLIIAQVRTMSLMLGMSGVVLCLGFLIGNTYSPNYYYIKQFASVELWAVIFGIYGVIKLTHAAFRVHYTVKIVNALHGIWAWTFLFLSFSIYDASPLAPTELLLVIPIVCELWELVAALLNYSTYHNRRKEDTR